MRKGILTIIVALFTLLMTLSLVVAAEDMGELTDKFDLTVDGVEVDGDTIGIEAGESIPIKVVFTAIENAEDVRLKVWIDGYREDIEDRTKRFELINGSTYSKLFSLEVPYDIESTEDYKLLVRLANKDSDDEDEFNLKLQRESYNVDVLSVEIDDEVTPGSRLALDVVLKNRGMHELEDMYVRAEIADLGAERRVYFGDLEPEDGCEDGCEDEDSVERRIYLDIPDDALAGIYNLEVTAYNPDITDTVTKDLKVKGEGELSDILSGVTSRTIGIGQEASYDLVLVNKGQDLKVYTLTPEPAEGLLVNVDPIVTVAGGSSKTVDVDVRATESVQEGTHNIAINVESAGQQVKRAVFSVNVEGEVADEGASNSIVVLTIILAIIFVVLLVILIVLLTRKPTIPEGEETSYY